MPKITMSELKKMPKSKKLRVYAGGEIRTVTAGWLLRQKQEAAKKNENLRRSVAIRLQKGGSYENTKTSQNRLAGI